MNYLKYCRSRMIVMLILGFASGFPISLTTTTVQAWYTVAGVNIETIGILTLVGLPYLLKFLWAPIMDRFIPPFFGRRRGWVVITQVWLIILIVMMAFLNPINNTVSLALVTLLIAFSSASQDINLDAYRTDLLDPEERGLGSALYINGWRAATFVSGGLALVMAQYIGWHYTLLFLASIVMLCLITTVLAEEPHYEYQPPRTFSAAVLQPFQEFLSRRYAVLLLILVILYKFGDAFALSLSTTFYLRGIGLTLAEVGAMTKSISIAATVIGTFIGGVVMLRIKLYRSLMLFGILQACANLLYMTLAIVGKNYLLVAIAITTEHLSSGMATVVFLAYLMSLCDRRYTATQFALLSAVAAVGRIFIGPLASYIVAHSGWAIFFAWSFVFSLPGLILLWWLRNRIDFDGIKINE